MKKKILAGFMALGLCLGVVGMAATPAFATPNPPLNTDYYTGDLDGIVGNHCRLEMYHGNYNNVSYSKVRIQYQGDCETFAVIGGQPYAFEWYVQNNYACGYATSSTMTKFNTGTADPVSWWYWHQAQSPAGCTILSTNILEAVTGTSTHWGVVKAYSGI